MFRIFYYVLLYMVASGASISYGSVDCSEAYNGLAAECEQIECSEKFKTFLGTWKGPFQIYSNEFKRFLKYANTVTYKAEDCLKNIANGDTFIIGRKTDVYEEVRGDSGEVMRASETKVGLLITGKNALGEKFLRTVDKENGLVDYTHVFSDDAAELGIWRYDYRGDAKNKPMKITIIDGRDLSVSGREHKRLVTLTMEGDFDPAADGVEKFVGGSGYHSLEK